MTALDLVATLFLMSGLSYQARLASEQSIYKDCVDVHSLPPIFHYWSDKCVRPKLEEFGFSNPRGAFSLYLGRACARRGGQPSRFVSIGAGNCDLEIEIAGDLRAQGHTEFSIECLDLNPAMLERGARAAENAGVGGNLEFTTADFNEWMPPHEYDGIVASQSLHHVMELEKLFARVKESLRPDAPFVISDMIGRNGHLRWPEALETIEEFWRKLPPSYRFNRKLMRYEESFQDWDCSGEGFEGVRAQDILPLLLDQFHFETFIGFANIIDPFVDRVFGNNFDPTRAWDRAFIDSVHASDEAALQSGRVKPTHMVAVVGTNSRLGTKYNGNLSPRFSVRDPNEAYASRIALPSAGAYQIDSLPHTVQRELEIIGTALHEATERVQELTAWGNRLDVEALQRDAWAFSLEKDCHERTAWARRLDEELGDMKARAGALESESNRRAAWARDLDAQLTDRTAWALSLEADLGHAQQELERAIELRKTLEAEVEARTAWALRVTREFEERTAWALSLERDLQARPVVPPWLVPAVHKFNGSPWRVLWISAMEVARSCKRRIIGTAS